MIKNMKIDLHCHTIYSYDGTSSIQSIIKEAKRKGINGIAVTDHDNTNAWKEALEQGEKEGFEIILGEEIKSSKGDILGLFITNHIDGKGKDPKWIIQEIKKQNGLVIIPHPFHFGENFKGALQEYAHLIDGIEIFNGRRPFSKGDKLAEEFANKYNLIKTGGSDSHYYKTIGNAFTECEANTLEEFKNKLQKRETKVFGKKSSIKYFFFPFMRKIGIIKNPI